jgi:hypothetical protein
MRAGGEAQAEPTLSAAAHAALRNHARRLQLRELEELYRTCQLDQLENPPGNDLLNSDEGVCDLRSNALNYGEMTVPAFADLLDLAWPDGLGGEGEAEGREGGRGGGEGCCRDRGGVFVDLGGGTGTLVLAAALLRPRSFRVCKGVELVDELVHKAAAAQLVAQRLFRQQQQPTLHSSCTSLPLVPVPVQVEATALGSGGGSSSSWPCPCQPRLLSQTVVGLEDRATEVCFEVGDITDPSTWLTAPELALVSPPLPPPDSGWEMGQPVQQRQLPPCLVFICCTLFDAPLLAAVSALCDRLPPLSVVASVSKQLPSLRFQPMQCSPVTMQMSWGVSEVHLQQLHLAP